MHWVLVLCNILQIQTPFLGNYPNYLKEILSTNRYNIYICALF